MIPVFTHIRTSRFSANSSGGQYVTVNQTVTPLRLALLAIHTSVASGTANTPTVTGVIATWTLLATATTSIRKVTLWYGLTGASPTTEGLTMDFAGQEQLHMDYSLNEVADCLLSGSNGVDAFVQSVTGFTPGASTTSFELTLPSPFSHAHNRAFGAFALGGVAQTLFAGSNFAILGQASGNGPPTSLATEYGRDGDLIVDMTTTPAAFWRAIAVEIAGEADVPAPSDVILRRTRRRGLNSRIN